VETGPKYSLPEIERRWLVRPEDAGNLDRSPYWLIRDLYISGTRLRLRSVEHKDGKVIHKLGKKYGKSTEISEPITNLYLTSEEYGIFSRLPGKAVRKRRYKVGGGSLDRYEQPGFGHLIFELEFPDEASARNYTPPIFVPEEITGRDEYSGFALACREA
jgi:CYTH domain-containing protein